MSQQTQVCERDAEELDARRDRGFGNFAKAIGHVMPRSESIHPARVPSDEDRGAMMEGDRFDGLS